jgi:hypothetical protein
MYILYDCSYRNAAKRVNDMRHMAEGAMQTVTQMFQRAVFRFGNSSAFGGKAFADRRALQTKMMTEALVDLKRALNWEKEASVDRAREAPQRHRQRQQCEKEEQKKNNKKKRRK